MILSVSPVTTINIGVSLNSESTSGAVELEGPQEVVGLLEVGAEGVNLVDEILNASNVVFTEDLSNDLVVGQGDSLTVNLSITSLVDEIGDGLSGGVSVGDVGVDSDEEVQTSLVELNEGGVVELSESEESQDLSDLGVLVVDTRNSGNEGDLGLSGDIVSSISAGLSLGLNEVSLLIEVLLIVSLSAGSPLNKSLFIILLSLGSLLGASSLELGVSISFLADVLGNPLLSLLNVHLLSLGGLFCLGCHV